MKSLLSSLRHFILKWAWLAWCWFFVFVGLFLLFILFFYRPAQRFPGEERHQGVIAQGDAFGDLAFFAH